MDRVPFIVLLASLAGGALAAEPPLGWYVGIGGGVSRLTPDTDDSDFTLEEPSSAAFGALVGIELGRRYAIELGATRLGEAGLSDDESVGYTTLGIGALAYLVGDAARPRRGERWAGFARLGVGVIDNESDVPLERKDNTAPWLGLGVDVPIRGEFALRAELASFDGDARASTVSLLWRPRPPGEADVSVARVEPPATIEPTPTPVPAPTTTIAGGVLDGVGFEPGTAALTGEGERALERLAASLLAHPAVIVEIRAYAESAPLARARTIATARHLAAQDVPIARLRARAFTAPVDERVELGVVRR